jgi:hypothetical protein
MTSFQKVNHFMGGYIFKKPGRKMDQAQVQPYPGRIDITASPAGFHFPDTELTNFNPYQGLPFFKNKGDGPLYFFPATAVNQALPVKESGTGLYDQLNMIIPENTGRLPLFLLHHSQGVSLSLKQKIFPRGIGFFKGRPPCRLLFTNLPENPVFF